MKQENVISIGTVGLSALVGLMALLLSTPNSSHDGWFFFHIPLALTLTYSCLHIGAAVLFLSTLDTYKAKLRRAFLAICAGMVILALGTLQVALIAAFNWWKTPWALDGPIVVPFLVAGVVAYSGTRALGTLIGLTSLLTRARFIIPVVFLLSFLIILVPHPLANTPVVAFDISNVIISWTTLMFLTASFVLVLVKRHIGEHYKIAMGWLAAGFLTATLVLIIAMGHTLAMPNATQDGVSVVTDFVGVIAGLFYVRAGYAFMKTREL